VATPQAKLAESLEKLKAVQGTGAVAIRARDLSRVHRDRLRKNGFLLEVLKGWFIPTRPGEPDGDTTAWYASFWDFCADYLRERFADEWSLSPEQSLLLQVGNRTVPEQLIVRASVASNNRTGLAHNTELLEVRATLPVGRDRVTRDRLNLYSLPAALIACAPRTFLTYPTDLRTALVTIRDASDVLAGLLEGAHSVVAGRLAGAFRNVGRDDVADEIKQAMGAAGFVVNESDPFEQRIELTIPAHRMSPYASRIRLLWQTMRASVSAHFPAPPGLPAEIDAYLARVDEAYVTDAYHSLSIEGYRVSAELIERVRNSDWNPDGDESDRRLDDGLAAAGYARAFQAVKKSLGRVLRGENSGKVAEQDHRDWYRQMFAPRVSAGLIPAASLAGYRNTPVYIRNSMHIPPPSDAVRDAMPILFEMLEEEAEPAVRVVLGHFVLVYIHPYVDGNGRMGRFLMNVMLASAGYPWTVVPLQRRRSYMLALEDASVRQNIGPLSMFLGELVRHRVENRPLPSVPS
jgi:hypothetical protein